jgi:alginate O-acetyltransferase complex protein AlgI
MSSTFLLDLLKSDLVFAYTAAIALIVVAVELVSRLKQTDLKRAVIIAISVLFLGWMDVYSLIILTVLAIAIIAVVKMKIDLQGIIYLLSLLLIGLLIFIKDYRFIFSMERAYVPLGVSYYFFRLIAFLIEYSKRPEEISAVRPLDYFSWVFFFPVFLAGPILRFDDFHAIDPGLHPSRKPIYYRNLAGAVLLKIVLVDMVLYHLAYVSLYNVIEIKLSDVNWYRHQYLNLPYLSLFAFAAFGHAYLDLMLYTEISKAVAGILGFTNIDNFDRPLLASNISMFWQRWHMSLSHWTRDYIFFPMLIKTKRTWLSTYASMFILGIWHSANLNWIAWALCHATAINMYGAMRRTPIFQRVAGNRTGAIFLRISGNVVTIYFVTIVFTFVAIDDFSVAVKFLVRCF